MNKYQLIIINKEDGEVIFSDVISAMCGSVLIDKDENLNVKAIGIIKHNVEGLDYLLRGAKESIKEFKRRRKKKCRLTK